MIKVNLNKTKSSTIYDTNQNTGLAPAGTVLTAIKEQVSKMEINLSPSVFVKMIINIWLILCFPLGLKIYEIQQINKLENEKQKEETTLKGIQDRLAQLKKEIKDYGHLKAKAKEYADKKAFLKQLAESRLVIPRTIDLIQNKMPETVWLENLKLKIQDKGNQLEISGKSFSEDHVNRFASSLHDILDKNSITVNTRDVKEGSSIVKVQFQLKGIIGEEFENYF